MSTSKEDKKLQYERRQALLNSLAEFQREHDPATANPEDDEFVLVPRSDVSPPEQPEKTISNPDGLVDIVTFCEHPYYLNLQLTPWQSVILKSFYMGSEGNTHLKLIDNKPATGCDSCVWNYVRKNEEKIALTELKKGEFRRMPSKLPWENSPCLKCDRFDPELRKKRFEQLIGDAVDIGAKEDRQKMESDPMQDGHTNEMDLIESDEIQPRVRDQIMRKLGRNFNEMVLVLGRRSGKALDVATPMLTTEGWKTMGDLKEGDFVYGPDGQPTKVIATTSVMERRPCYRLTFSNGETLVADAQHEWVTETALDRSDIKHGHHNPIPTRTTEEISKTILSAKKGRYRHNHSIKLAQPIQNSDAELPIEPYLLGTWLGETHRQDATSKIAQIIGHKHIPNEYFNSSQEQRTNLLHGFLESDSSTTSNKQAEFVTKDKSLAEDVLKLCCSLGCKAFLESAGADLRGRTLCRQYKIVWNLQPCHIGSSGAKVKDTPSIIFITEAIRIPSVPVKCIQVDNESHMYLAGRALIPTHNSFLVSVIALYQVYRLIMMGHPQLRYGLMPYDIITILNVAKSEEQAKGSIFEKIWGLVAESPYFFKYVGHKIQTQMHIRTEADLLENDRRVKNGQEPWTGSIHLISGHSNSTTLVGKTVCTLILDEMAEMAGERGDDGTDRRLYEKLQPSTANFGREGKVICISNPLLEVGKFYELYQSSFEDNGMIMFQLPTWLSNPTVEKSFIERARIKEPQSFGMQYAAVFEAGGREPFLPREYLDSAVARGAGERRKESGIPHVDHFIHVDPAHNNDLYTLVVVHAEPDPHRRSGEGSPLMKIVVDHVHFWRARGKNQPIDSNAVDTYILSLAKRFRLSQISYDHWLPSAPSVMKLANHGLNVKIKSFTARYQDAIFTNLFDLFATDRIDLYTIDSMSMDEHGNNFMLGDATETIRQLEHLQKVYKGNKPKIEALTGFNDDICDCIAAAAFEAIHTVVSKKLPRGGLVNMGRLI